MTSSKDILVLNYDYDSANLLATALHMHLLEATFQVVHTGEDVVRVGVARFPGIGIFDLEMSGMGSEACGTHVSPKGFCQSNDSDSPLGESYLSCKATKEGLFDYCFSKPLEINSIMNAIHAFFY